MIEKRDGEGIAGVMELPILAGIGEAGYVWIPICFKGLKAFSCRQGRGVLNTPYRRPPRGRMVYWGRCKTAPLELLEGRMLLRPYSLPAGGIFSYG